VLLARQVSRRTGEIECELSGDRVLLRGRAITTRTGSFVLPEAKSSAPAHSLSPGVVAVIFTSSRTEGDRGYEAMANAMVDLASKQPGFLGVESVRGADGVGITVSYWASDADVLAWKQIAAHLVAQERGKSTWYRGFKMRICRVERAYAFGEQTW
jgi:heme-degrading monooxygenase HmoA